MPQSLRLTTQRADAWRDIHLHISPWQERVVFDEVQFFGDSLLSHEEYLHSHKWRAVNKLPCGEPQSRQTFFLQGRQRSGRWQSFSSSSYSYCSHGSITFNALNKIHHSLAYLWLLVPSLRLDYYKNKNLMLCGQPFLYKSYSGCLETLNRGPDVRLNILLKVTADISSH